MGLMQITEVKDSQIVEAAISLGPCTPKQVLEELGAEPTPESKARVDQVLQDNLFTRHGGVWCFEYRADLATS